MSDPSFLNVPYRFKAGTLYSQIPESGLGDLVVTRATTPTANLSTRVNASGFIELVANNVPRLDYPLGGIAAGCPALLVEPSAVNNLLQSEAFNTTWTLVGLNAFGSGSVANSTGTTDPFGATNADYIQENASPGTHVILQTPAGQVSGTTYTFSCFVKSAERTQVNFLNNAGGGGSATFNLSAGTATLLAGVSASIQNYGNGWYRCILTYTPTATVNFNVQIRLADASGNTSYTGTGTSGVYVFGAQLEVGSIATSYIPTTTQAITRGDEVIRKTNVASLIGQSEGTIYAEVDIRNLGASVSIINVQTASYTSGAVRIETNANQIRIQIRDVSGVNCLDATIASPTLSAGINKIALGYSSVASGVVTALNGSIISTTTVTNAYTNIGANRVYLGTRETGGFNDLFFNNRIRAVALYPTRLTNAQLQALTT
jgi:hypothetical protein